MYPEVEVLLRLRLFYLLWSVIDIEIFQIFPCWYALINMFLVWSHQLKPSMHGCKPFNEEK